MSRGTEGRHILVRQDGEPKSHSSLPEYIVLLGLVRISAIILLRSGLTPARACFVRGNEFVLEDNSGGLAAAIMLPWHFKINSRRMQSSPRTFSH